jgi:hypothetical protein
MAGYQLKSNPDEAARKAKPQMYTKSLEGGPPSTEYAKKADKTTGPVNPLSTTPPRNRRGGGK